MKRDRVVLLAGRSADAVDRVREVLERNNIFAVGCRYLGALLSNGKAPSLVIVCRAGSANKEVWRRGCPSLRQFEGRISSNPVETFAIADEIARSPVPVLVVHERPTAEEVNYLRSCGAYYVIDRRADESRGWRRLLACVAEVLAGEVTCSFCGRKVERFGGCVVGAGQASLCRQCLSAFSRKMLSPAPQVGVQGETPGSA